MKLVSCVSFLRRARCLRTAALAALLVLRLCAAARAQAETADDRKYLDELRDAFRSGGTYASQRDLAEYLQDFPESGPAHRLAAQVAFGRGQLDEAGRQLAAAAAAGEADPELQGRLALRRGRTDEALALAAGGTLKGLAATWLQVAALDGAGRRTEARRVARTATDAVDDRTLDGRGLLDFARLLLFQRRFEMANQALVFADAELNGKRGPRYHLVEPEALLLLGEVYAATRQSAQGGADPSLALLNEVLAVDASQPAALVTKARVYLYGMNGRAAEAALQQALGRDPSFPDALVLLGRTRLLDRRVEDARALARKVLDVDGHQRDALALEAAALEIAGRATEAAAARAAFVAAHPESGALDALLGETLQSHYRFAESVAPLERALAQEPDDEEPLPVLAQSLAHLGRETEARAALEEHARRSPYPYPWRTNMLAVLERLSRDVELVTEGPNGFRLRLPPGEQEVLGPLLAARLLAARADMAARWGVEPKCEVLVEVFDHHGDFSVRTVGFEGFLALGACFGCVLTMLSPLCELRGQFAWAQTAVHEYAHVVTLEVSHNRVPRWLTEGVSVFEEKKADPAWGRELERDVLSARANGWIFPVEHLDEAFRDGQTVMLGYYQASLLCELIERDFGFGRLKETVAGYADGSDTGAVIRKVLGIEPAELDRRFAVYLQDVVAARAALRPKYDEAGKDRLRAAVAAGDVDSELPLASAYHDLGRRADEESALQAYLAARGETPAAQRVLAERDLAAGRKDAALRRLQAWEQTGTLDADGLHLLAGLLASAGDKDGARAALRRACDVFPADVGQGSALAELLQLTDPKADAPEFQRLLEELCAHDENEIEARLKLAELATDRGDAATALRRTAEAAEIDPYRPQVRMDLADMLLAQGDTAGARAQWTLVLGMRAEQVPHAAGVDEHAGLEGFSLKGAAPTLEIFQSRARKRLAETAPPGAPPP